MTGHIELVVRAFEDSGVRYLIVGGVAVVLHGHLRTTADVDLWIELERANLDKAVRCLRGLGYRPRAPVAIEDFADAAKRRDWVETKGLVVFSLWNPENPLEVDLFVSDPLDFTGAYGRAVSVALETTRARVIGIADLITMKEAVGRPLDLEDIRALRALRDAGPGGAS